MRKCFNCQEELPPETEHYEHENEVYCTECIDAQPYTAYVYYLDGEYIGNSEDEQVRHIESYDDEYEEGAS